MTHQVSMLSLYNTHPNSFIPIIGLGTWLLESELADVLLTAFKCGYKLVDSAVEYENEQYIGQVLETGIIKRDNLFLCTKV